MHNPTIFLDIDGTLLQHQGNLSLLMVNDPLLIKGTIDKLNEWEKIGCKIVLTTGRKESQRSLTVQQLEKLGIFYDLLIMGLGGGPRYLINDKKGDGTDTAFAINLIRNYGISEIKITC